MRSDVGRDIESARPARGRTDVDTDGVMTGSIQRRDHGFAQRARRAGDDDPLTHNRFALPSKPLRYPACLERMTTAMEQEPSNVRPAINGAGRKGEHCDAEMAREARSRNVPPNCIRVLMELTDLLKNDDLPWPRPSTAL